MGVLFFSMEFLNIIVRGFAMASDNSRRTRGCNFSGPGDLLIFNLFNFVMTVLSVMLMSFNSFGYILLSKWGISSVGSIVKTLLKFRKKVCLFLIVFCIFWFVFIIFYHKIRDAASSFEFWLRVFPESLGIWFCIFSNFLFNNFLRFSG